MAGQEEHWKRGWAIEGDADQLWRESRPGRSTRTLEGNRTLKTAKHSPKHRNDRTATNIVKRLGTPCMMRVFKIVGKILNGLTYIALLCNTGAIQRFL